MALQFDLATRDDWLDDLDEALGPSAMLYFYTGAPPVNCAASPTGTLLSSGVRGNASGWGVVDAGVLTGNSFSPDASAAATGVAGYFRWLDSAGGVHFQGTVSLPGQGGDLTMVDTEITATDTVQVTSWTITAPGA